MRAVETYEGSRSSRCSGYSVYGTIFPLQVLFMSGDPYCRGWKLIWQLEMCPARGQDQHAPLDHLQTSRQSELKFWDLLGALVQDMW
ncbi:hypothetical protein Trydic_g3140 [Trypoxylus dichotomus]